MQFDDSSGTLQDISAYVMEINGVKKSAVTVDGTTAGMAWRSVLDSTLREADDITLTMFYDDTATTGPWALFNDIGGPTPAAGREFKVTFGSTKTYLIPTLIKSVERDMKVGELTMLIAVLGHTSGVAPTEA